MKPIELKGWVLAHGPNGPMFVKPLTQAEVNEWMRAKRKPRVLWSTYEATLKSKHPKARQSLLNGDWVLESDDPHWGRNIVFGGNLTVEPAQAKRKHAPKRNKLTPAARKHPRKPPGR